MVGKRGDKREAVAQRPYRVDEVPFDEYYGDQHLRAAIDALAAGDRGPFTEIYPTRPWSAFRTRRSAAE